MKRKQDGAAEPDASSSGAEDSLDDDDRGTIVGRPPAPGLGDTSESDDDGSENSAGGESDGGSAAGKSKRSSVIVLRAHATPSLHKSWHPEPGAQVGPREHRKLEIKLPMSGCWDFSRVWFPFSRAAPIACSVSLAGSFLE